MLMQILCDFVQHFHPLHSEPKQTKVHQILTTFSTPHMTIYDIPQHISINICWLNSTLKLKDSQACRGKLLCVFF